MTLNREIDWKNPTTVLSYILEQWTKHNIRTCLPGIVDAYDADTRRARIVPALRLVMSDEDDPSVDGEAVPRALAVNVPVLFPSSSAGIVLFDLDAGDVGLLLFSERGITEFKRTGQLSTPDKARFFDESDAMFYPCDFGVRDVTAAAAGLTVQSLDGERSVRLGADSVEAHAGDQNVTIGPDDVVVNATGDVRLNAGGNIYLGESDQKRLVTVDFLRMFYNLHSHGAPGTPPAIQAPVNANAGQHLTEKTRAQ